MGKTANVQICAALTPRYAMMVVINKLPLSNTNLNSFVKVTSPQLS